MSDLLAPGDRLLGDEYEVIAHLGSGAFADVYHVFAPAMGEGAHFALKLIRPNAARGVASDVVADYEQRFAQEMALATRIHDPRHPLAGREHVIQVYRIGRDATTGALCAAMELAVEGSLAKVGRLATAEAMPLFLGMLRGLKAVHDVGAIHRDIKPANILLAAGGKPKIGDLGLAQLPTGMSKGRSIGGSIGAVHPGTPEYMSPEHGSPQALLPTSDIYSLGAVFFEMVTGQLWLRGQLLGSTLREVVQARLLAGKRNEHDEHSDRLVDLAADDIPEWLDTVVMRMLLPTPGRAASQRHDAGVRWVLVEDVIAAVERGEAAEGAREAAVRAQQAAADRSKPAREEHVRHETAEAERRELERAEKEAREKVDAVRRAKERVAKVRASSESVLPKADRYAAKVDDREVAKRERAKLRETVVWATFLAWVGLSGLTYGLFGLDLGEIFGIQWPIDDDVLDGRAGKISDEKRSVAPTLTADWMDVLAPRTTRPPMRPVSAAEVPIADNQPRIWIDEVALTDWLSDLGTISGAVPVEREFTVRNIGSGLLTVEDLSSSCGCVAAAVDLTEIWPNETAKLRVYYDPRVNADAGTSITKQVRIRSDDPLVPLAEFAIQADVAPLP